MTIYSRISRRRTDGFKKGGELKKISIILIVALAVLSCGCEMSDNCYEEQQVIQSQEAIIELRQGRIDDLETQLPCEVCEDCPECPEGKDCPECLDLKEYYSIGELKDWLKQDKTDETYTGDRNKIAMDLMLSALNDGYIMTVYPYKQTCPNKHYLLNLVLITREHRALSINAETDEVTFHALPYP